MDKEYSKEELEDLTDLELCEMAVKLNIINIAKLIQKIWNEVGV